MSPPLALESLIAAVTPGAGTPGAVRKDSPHWPHHSFIPRAFAQHLPGACGVLAAENKEVGRDFRGS